MPPHIESDGAFPNLSLAALVLIAGQSSTGGVDHKRLTYKFQGRHFRLTDVAGERVNKLLA